MKKKLLKVLVLCLLIATSLFVVSACNMMPSGDGQEEKITKLQSAHNAYAVYTVKEGKSPLSYADWVDVLKGDSEEEPTGSGKYWRYVDGVPTAW